MELYRYIVKNPSIFPAYPDTPLWMLEIIKSPMGASEGQHLIALEKTVSNLRYKHSLYSVDPGDVIAVGTIDELRELYNVLWSAIVNTQK